MQPFNQFFNNMVSVQNTSGDFLCSLIGDKPIWGPQQPRLCFPKNKVDFLVFALKTDEVKFIIKDEKS